MAPGRFQGGHGASGARHDEEQGGADVPDDEGAARAAGHPARRTRAPEEARARRAVGVLSYGRLLTTYRRGGLLLLVRPAHTFDDAQLRFVSREDEPPLEIQFEPPHPPARSLHQ